MYDVSDVFLVDPHSKSNRRNQEMNLTSLPFVLDNLLIFGCPSGMEVVTVDAQFQKPIAEQFTCHFVEAVHDARLVFELEIYYFQEPIEEYWVVVAESWWLLFYHQL